MSVHANYSLHAYKWTSMLAHTMDSTYTFVPVNYYLAIHPVIFQFTKVSKKLRFC